MSQNNERRYFGAVEAALLDAGLGPDPELIEALAECIEALAAVEAARLIGGMLASIGTSPTAIAIERRLLDDRTPLRRAAATNNINPGSLHRAEKRLKRLLTEKCNAHLVGLANERNCFNSP